MNIAKGLVDAQELLANLSVDDLRERIESLDRAQQALKVLLRAAIVRDRRQQPTAPPPDENAAYEDLARAARRLREAQARARKAAHRTRRGKRDGSSLPREDGR